MVKSAARILDLLELMAALPGPVRLSEAARRLGIPKSSASALFDTLAAKGYAVSTSDGFTLAAPFRRDGWAGGHLAFLGRAARPIMIRLVEQTNESAFVGIMTSDWKIQYVDKVTSTNALRYDVELTHMRPAYNTSIGHVLLADQPEDALERLFTGGLLPKTTPQTVTDPERLRAVLAEVRRRGYSESESSNVVGVHGVAAGIRRADGRVIAGIAVIAPSARFKTIRAEVVKAVKSAADEISIALLRIDETFTVALRQNPPSPIVAMSRSTVPEASAKARR